MKTIHDDTPGPATPEALPRINVIITEDHFAVMDPPVPLLEPLLQYRIRSFVPGGPTGVQEKLNTFTLCKFDHMERLEFLAGLLPRIRLELRKHGYRMRIDDRRNATPLEVDEEVVGECNCDDEDLLKVVARTPLAQIQVPHSERAMERCVLFCRAFPNARIAFAVTRRHQRKRERSLAGPPQKVIDAAPQPGYRRRDWAPHHWPLRGHRRR
jgi:hypothetical protein